MPTAQEFIDQYLDLLIIQYSDSPNAVAEVTLKATEYSKIFEFYNSFYDAFDLDLAIGDQLDIIGKIVGIPRIVPFSLAKQFFGFDDNTNSLSFDVGTFFDKFTDVGYTDTELSDIQMRRLIKAKVAKNITSPYMVSDERISLQDVINSAFSGAAYVVDNYDMFMTLYVDESVIIADLTLINNLNLLPSTQGVGYKSIISYSTVSTFGFSDNTNAKTFGEGVFANRLLI